MRGTEMPPELQGFPYHTYGNYVAVEIPNEGGGVLKLFRPDDPVFITWRSENDYIANGVPSPRKLKGKRICEVGPGLANFALKCDSITIIEPCDYSQLKNLLLQTARDSKRSDVIATALFLAKQAYLYDESPNITQIQADVEYVVDQYRNQFDVVISSHLVDWYSNPRGIIDTICSMGRDGADFYIF